MTALFDRIADQALALGIPITPAGVADIDRLLTLGRMEIEIFDGEGPHVRADGTCAHCEDGWTGGEHGHVLCSYCLGRGVPQC